LREARQEPGKVCSRQADTFRDLFYPAEKSGVEIDGAWLVVLQTL
jgi:hypothetical protein